MMQQAGGTTNAGDLVRRFYDVVWNRTDEQVAREILHPRFSFRASLGEYTCTIDELLVDGQKAAARMTVGGRHQGEFFGVSATGRSIAWAGAAFFETDGRQITRLWVLGDVDGVKQQLGVDTRRTF
ncbi:ester cyclase [Hyphomicrobium sp.]|uniref:ester cyclase n=1 Tax=Hyphomicrobium sp. TaxID=82 RepID=UPI002E348EAC|nr:ester cyclase [Hyphomicrobium sp.]HEX2843163.1 ester cyclase [Hyphomicrobium sp.]